ncbi:MAG: dihydrolipoyl dehydrogenase [candidate division NC10 bacterium]|nr:dihydrolipoyl dehydrogenase [candidate division NC10 bacterium]
MAEKYDLVVIGSGPGGYVGAIRAAQLGMRVAIVERDRLGGVCLNWGCIPTKALLRNAEIIALLRRGEEFGFSFENLRLDFSVAVKRSEQAARKLSKGVEYLMKKNKVTVVPGEGRLAGDGQVGVARDAKVTELQAARILLATGSRPREIPGVPIDGKRVITSTEALSLPQVPRSLLIIGAGAVGVEFADVYHAYGAEVILIEMLPRLLSVEDAEISTFLEKVFAKRGITIRTGTKVEGVTVKGDQVALRLSKEGKTEEITGDVALVAIGRIPNIEALGIEGLGLKVGRGNFIEVGDRFETSVPGIYAIGDVIGGPLLAHKAMAEAVVAVEAMAGQSGRRIDPSKIPNCTYCSPQVASVGLTEEQAKEKGRQVKVGRFSFQASGKAVALGDTEGFVKVVADAEYGEILGLHIIGPEATEMIAEATMARTLEATLEEVHHSIHAHPTLSETVAEACLAALGRPIHI